MTSTDQLETKQAGYCETCGKPAFTVRHSNGIELTKQPDGSVQGKAWNVEYPMCYSHYEHYIWHMEKKRKELEKKRGKYGRR